MTFDVFLRRCVLLHFFPNRLMQAKKITSLVAAFLLLGTMFAALTLTDPSHVSAYRTQCSDGLDNDNDGRTDYPEDNDCENLDDDFEGYSNTGLFVSVTDGKEEVAPGGSLVYRITLKQQRDTHRDVNIDLHFPVQVDLVSATDGGRIMTGGRIHWDNVTVFKDSVRVLTVNANVRTDAPQDQLIIARVIADGEQATDTTRVEGERELQGKFSLFLTDNQTYSLPGNTLYYTLKVKNGTDSARTTDVKAILGTEANYITSSAGSEFQTSNNILWRNITFGPREERTFTFAAHVSERLPENYSLRTRAIAGQASTVDETLITKGIPSKSLSVSLSDGRTNAARGDLLTYKVNIQNRSSVLATDESITATLPINSEFVSATEGGVWDGNVIHWQHIQVAPNGIRNLSYTVRVRSDAVTGTELMANVQVNGGTSVDYTVVGGASSFGNTYNPGEITRGRNDLLFTKVASTDEAVPGGTVRYTLTVRNILSEPMTDAVVSDRFDTSLLSLGDMGDAQILGGGRLQWNVPALQPGDAWQTSYTLQVSPRAPRGQMLTNIATITGSNIGSLSLTQRVRTVRTGVFTGMPQTGAAMDIFFTLMTGAGTLSIAGTQALRRKYLGA